VALLAFELRLKHHFHKIGPKNGSLSFTTAGCRFTFWVSPPAESTPPIPLYGEKSIALPDTNRFNPWAVTRRQEKRTAILNRFSAWIDPNEVRFPAILKIQRDTRKHPKLVVFDGKKRLKPISKTANTPSMKPNRSILFTAWKQLLLAYVISLIFSLIAGMLLVKVGHIQPEHIFEASTKRISHVLPVFELGTRFGIDLGVLLFAWNAFGALATISFIYTAAFFNPDHLDRSPRAVRKIFCGSKRMKLLCYLPGCNQIEVEALRRLCVWLMVPLLGLILLGIESGLQVATAAYLRGSLISAAIPLLPHGLIEIPAFAMAGAVTYSAHLLVRKAVQHNSTHGVFQQVELHRRALPMRKIILWVVFCLLAAGLVEAHVTTRIMQML
jgi:uncharacterized membrane protein SpoIIM required for sporulation